MRTRTVALAGLGWLALGCQSRVTHDSTAASGESPSVAKAAAPAFEADLLRIAKEYRTWTRVSDQPARSPTDCRPPVATNGVLKSESEDASSHGRKLYFLFAKDPDTYRAAGIELVDEGARAALANRLVGQALVKESWHQAVVRTAEAPKLDPRNSDPHKASVEYADRGEYAYRTGEQADLFVMYKLAPATPGTDQGWVYGTVSPDGGRVTSSGRVASCMRCHDESTRDHLLMVPHLRMLAAPPEVIDRINRLPPPTDR